MMAPRSIFNTRSPLVLALCAAQATTACATLNGERIATWQRSQSRSRPAKANTRISCSMRLRRACIRVRPQISIILPRRYSIALPLFPFCMCAPVLLALAMGCAQPFFRGRPSWSVAAPPSPDRVHSQRPSVWLRRVCARRVEVRAVPAMHPRHWRARALIRSGCRGPHPAGSQCQ